MTSKYCDNCGHEKIVHLKRKNKCKVKNCNCQIFERGPERNVQGDILK